MEKVLAIGNEVVLKAAIDAGATMYCGYPITPSTEILAGWAKLASKNDDLIFLQSEDEISAGFAVIGGILSGRKAWTATAGVGNILMQDGLAMAEAMRIPMVVYVAQRGGPSTGTVIFSQQELVLTSHGGNGEGLRIVYSPGNLQELYDFTFKAFNSAWKYRFPTFILSDGYLSKTMGEVEYKKIETVPSEPILQNKERIERGEYVNIRNCYSLEDEIAAVLRKDISEYKKISTEAMEFEEYHIEDADLLIFAHGSVSMAAKAAVLSLREEGLKVGLFRPITVRPLPEAQIKMATAGKAKLMVVEASEGQFSVLIKSILYKTTNSELYEFLKPAEGITPEEIYKKAKEIL